MSEVRKQDLYEIERLLQQILKTLRDIDSGGVPTLTVRPASMTLGSP